ncbi:LuxR C-terminal-related transcriptional regulator [Streptomyces avermitilis]
MLEPLGLGAHAAEVYRAMLKRPDFGVEDLVTSLGWEQDLVRSALDECVRLSLIKPSWDAPGGLRAVSPEIGLQALLARQESEFLERQQRIAESRIEVARFVDEYTAAQQKLRSTVVERLVGIDDIRSRIEEFTQECGTELLTFATGGPQSEASRQASRPLCEDLAKRATLGDLFDRVWESAIPFSGGRPQPRDRGEEELTGQEQAVLRLLGEGLTDEVVARKLGVSVRTGRRITAELMGRLGARSRFQAGLRAAQLGWLTGSDTV